MRHSAFQFLVVAILFVFVAAWTKEGTLPTYVFNSVEMILTGSFA